jgi:hypothetical protein
MGVKRLPKRFAACRNLLAFSSVIAQRSHTGGFTKRKISTTPEEAFFRDCVKAQLFMELQQGSKVQPWRKGNRSPASVTILLQSNLNRTNESLAFLSLGSRDLYPLALQDTLRRIKLRDFENHIRRPTLLDLRRIGEPVFRLSEYHEKLPAAFRLRVFQILAQLFVTVLLPVLEDLLVLAAFEAVLPTGVDHEAVSPSRPAPLRVLWSYSEMLEALGMSVFFHLVLPVSGYRRGGSAVLSQINGD